MHPRAGPQFAQMSRRNQENYVAAPTVCSAPLFPLATTSSAALIVTDRHHQEADGRACHRGRRAGKVGELGERLEAAEGAVPAKCVAFRRGEAHST